MRLQTFPSFVITSISIHPNLLLCLIEERKICVLLNFLSLHDQLLVCSGINTLNICVYSGNYTVFEKCICCSTILEILSYKCCFCSLRLLWQMALNTKNTHEPCLLIRNWSKSDAWVRSCTLFRKLCCKQTQWHSCSVDPKLTQDPQVNKDSLCFLYSLIFCLLLWQTQFMSNKFLSSGKNICAKIDRSIAGGS